MQGKWHKNYKSTNFIVLQTPDVEVVMDSSVYIY